MGPHSEVEIRKRENAGTWGSAFIWVKGGGLFLVLVCSLFGEFKT